MIDSRLQSLINAGAPLVRLGKGQKSPTEKGWSTTPTLTPAQYTANAAEWFGTGFNAGVRTGYPLNNGGFLVVLDVDIRSQAPEHIAQVAAALAGLGLNDVPYSVFSGRGGGSAHLYLRCMDELVLIKGVWALGESADSVDVSVASGKIERKKAWMLDLVSKGKQVVCPPSVHPDTGRPYVWAQEELTILDMPPQLLARVYELNQSHNNPRKAQGFILPQTTHNYGALPQIQGLQELPPTETTAEVMRVKSALAKLSADCSRNDWMVIVFALAWTGWDCAYALAYEYSASAPDKFDPQAFDVLWDSHKPTVSPTLGSLFAKAKAAGWTDESTPAYVDELNVEFFVVTHGGHLRICREKDMTLLSLTDFYALCKPRTVNVIQPDGSVKRVEAAKKWFEHPRRREFSCLTFAPECGVQPNAAGCYNRFTGFGIQPSAAWPTQNFITIMKFLKDIVSGGYQTEFLYLLLWLHHAVTRLGEPLGVALVLMTEERGAGKGTLNYLMSKWFGKHSRHVTQSSQVTGKFNGHLESCLYLFADEAIYTGDKQGEQVLKSYITEPRISIEEKGYPVRECDNHMRIVIATNNRRATNMSTDERRYHVCSFSPAQAQNRMYFEKLRAAIDGGGAADVLGYLLSDECAKQFKGQDPRFCIPNSEKLQAQKEMSLTGVPAGVYEMLIDEGLALAGDMMFNWDNDGLRVPCATLAAYMEERVDKYSVQGIKREIGKWLSKYGMAKRERESGGNRPWVYEFVGLNTARQIFATQILRKPNHDWE